MIYDFQKDFFLVCDDDTGTTKLFRHWWNVVNFLTDEIMKNEYHIIYDENAKGMDFGWRPPKDRKECFDFLYNIKNVRELNDILEDLWHTELIEFSD